MRLCGGCDGGVVGEVEEEKSRARWDIRIFACTKTETTRAGEVC